MSAAGSAPVSTAVSTLGRIRMVAEMQARDLLRRRVAMALFVLLPAAFYYSIPGDEEYGVVAGTMGVSWAVAAAGLFGALGWRRVDTRLTLLGARVVHALVGRLVLLLGLGTALVALFAPQILMRSSAVADGGALVLALALLALVSVPLGLTIGALLPRELEGTLVLIGIVGVEMSLPPDAGFGAVLPLYGPIQVLEVAAGLDDTVVGGVVHALVTTILLTAVAAVLWWRRTRVHPPVNR